MNLVKCVYGYASNLDVGSDNSPDEKDRYWKLMYCFEVVEDLIFSIMEQIREG